MTSKEIQLIAPTDASTNAWLKMIAHQLAILIEVMDSKAPQVQPIPEKRGVGRPRKVA
jgi:hypothetical protein